MYRVGLLGTENSHAMAFAKTLNLPDPVTGERLYPEFRVVACFAHEKAPSEAIVKECGEDIVIVESPEEMVDLVDCAMITSRHGKYHKEFAMPFLKAGKPCFIDKPFTVSIEDAKELVEIIEKNDLLVTGGSGCKFVPQIEDLIREIGRGDIGEVASCVFSFPGDRSSEYAGIFFYGQHLIEMVIKTFGDAIQSVACFEKKGHLTAIARYEDLDVVMNFTPANRYLAVAYGKKGNIVKELDISGIYPAEVENFVKMIRTGKMPLPLNDIVLPVYVLNAMEKSLAEGGRDVPLSELY
ncbi:MAG: Gfo/Idh/MocA family oxidoreductase [Clostridia bacterium]|nr:Gfo/Idh/MocA family oxidoreductase [Clostridia bacterium]